jgi:alpha-L-rhamnosidase
LKTRYQIASGILLVTLLLAGCGEGGETPRSVSLGDATIEAGPAPSPVSKASPTWVTDLDAFDQNHPIWAHASTPAPHEVVLFRHTFTLDEPMESAQLFIFADTRYEVWIDGLWTGRGPARFSRTMHEYDVHPLGLLQPGDHVVAVLVQWAPNNRRSESDTPFLLSQIQGVTSQGPTAIARTGSQWKALLSGAWRQDAVSVHSQKLIGPTELVDLRRLPPDWMSPTFRDDGWSAAVTKDPDGAVYRPRSIPLLTNVPFTPTVIDAGVLSPGRAVGELVPPVSDPYTFTFEALESTEFVVETLTGAETSPSGRILLDDDDLNWSESGARRPDVTVGAATIETGTHTLSFADIPAQGLTFGMSTQGIQPAVLPFQQGTHAGRRLLLAEPVSQSHSVRISSGEGVTVEFTMPPAYAVLDLGRVVHGRLRAQVAGPAGAVVDIGWDERLLTGTRRPLPYPGSLHPEWNQTDSWTLDGTVRSISTIDARAGRYVLIAGWGSDPIQLGHVQVYEERYPIVQRGWFSSSDGLLDAIWQVGVDTLYPNMTDAYTDTPWRERGQWWGDAYVEDQINRVAFGDTDLLRRGLVFMADAFTEGRPAASAPNTGSALLLDYGMLWVQSVYDYQQMTGGVQLSAQVYPVLCEFMAYMESYENPDTGLLDIPRGEWWETALIDWSAPDSRYGQSTAINALYYGTLVDASGVAEAVGATADALTWRQKADLVKREANTHLYLPTQHRYVTSIVQGQALPPSIHAQAWPLAYGLAPEQETDRLASSLLELLSGPETSIPSPFVERIEIYGMFWVLKALGEAGRIPEALDLIRTTYGRLLDRGATTWWEGFKTDAHYFSTLSHGWGGAPTWFLTTYVLGARRSGPDTWTVKPALDGVRCVSGSLPLATGELQVRCERRGCGESQLELIAPVTTTGEVVVPFADSTMVLTLNNRVIWQDGTPLADDVITSADGIHISLPGGDHTLHIVQDCRGAFPPPVLGEGGVRGDIVAGATPLR